MKQKTKNKLVKLFGPYLIKLLVGSLRIQTINKHILDEAKSKYKTVIYAFWHNRIFILSYAHRFENIQVLISRHRDGEYIALALSGLGYGAIRGSTSRGGASATRELISTIKEYDIAITPDGPRGPKEHVHEGVVYLAYKTGKPIIPLSANAKRKLILPSWDNFILPLPFSHAKVTYGEPIFVNSTQQMGSTARQLKQTLTEIGKSISF
jgi:hypothetical protein